MLDILNVRLWNGEEPDDVANERVDHSVWDMLRRCWEGLRNRIKINCSLGVVLKHRNSGELRYFHSSSNNATLYDVPRAVASQRQLREFYEDLSRFNLREHSSRRRPNSAWQLLMITNVTFYLYKMLGMGKVGRVAAGGGEGVRLPDFIRTNRHIVSVTHCTSGRGAYTDNLCFFRCLSIKLSCVCRGRLCACTRPVERLTRTLFHRYREYMLKLSVDVGDISSFEGVGCENLLDLETCFDINIVVMRLEADGESNTEWVSRRRVAEIGETLYLNIYENHFSLIKSIEGFSRAYACRGCDQVFARYSSQKRHTCLPEKASRFVFNGGSFGPPGTIFSRIKLLTGIEVTDPDVLYYPFVVTYDIECFLSREGLPCNTPSRTFDSRHEPLSVSVCSNVPGYTEPVCFIRRVDSSTAEEMIEEFVRYIYKISRRAEELTSRKFSGLYQRVQSAVARAAAAEKLFEDDGFSKPGVYRSREELCGLLEQLDKHISSIPVVGFNSAKYDAPIMKGYMLRAIQDIEDEDFTFVVKRVNSLTCVESRSFRFLDILNFIAPGFSYEKYIKAYGCSLSKGFFPYEWMDSLKKLDHPSLPPRSAFYNALKGENISEEDYEVCQEAWRSGGMTTFRDFVKWYNDLDVAPFVQAIETQSAVYREKGIDMLKSAVSLPGLAVHWLFKVIPQTPALPQNVYERAEVTRFIRQSQPICLLDDVNSDLYKVIKEGVVGGPAIVFHRYHERDKTFIRKRVYNGEARQCKKIIGVDANALYLSCLGREMPTGYPSRLVFDEQNQWGSASRHQASRLAMGKVSHGWLEYLAYTRGIRISHARNGGEVRLGQHNLPVDGFCHETRTVFQFHGCYWHGHPCGKNKDTFVNKVRGLDFAHLYKDTVRKENYLRELGFTVETIWECEWERQVRASADIKSFLHAAFSTLYPRTCKEGDSFDTCVERIRDGKFFGLVECDIRVPPELEEKFDEMSPIFKNVEIGRGDLSKHMQEFAEGKQFLQRPQRMLIGSLFGEKVLLLSELARWYLEHGLVITRIYQMVEYVPRRVFGEFANSVSNARRAGDADPDLFLLADTSKLIGNSAYGKTITDKEKHRQVKYVSGSINASQKVRRREFVNLEEVADDYYEVEMWKRQVSRGYC